MLYEEITSFRQIAMRASALNSELRGLGIGVVLLGKTLCLYNASLHPGV